MVAKWKPIENKNTYEEEIIKSIINQIRFYQTKITTTP